MSIHTTQLLAIAQHSICTLQVVDIVVVMSSPDVLRYLFDSLLMGKPGLNPRTVHVGFLMDRVASFTLEISVFPCQLSFYQCSILIYHLGL
jgi:hypothetical protein